MSKLEIEDLIKIAVKTLDAKKAVDIKVIKVNDLTSVTDYFIICNGTSSTHINTLADEVEHKLSQKGEPPLHREGYRSGNWVLIDYGAIIVNIFHKDVRDFYSLEKLWEAGEQIDINQFIEKDKK